MDAVGIERPRPSGRATNDTSAQQTVLRAADPETSSTAPVLSAGALLAAALALPGIVPAAYAQTAPDQSIASLRYFDYRDWQPGADRMRVRSPMLYLLKPLSDSLSVEGSVVYDAMSGASPLYFNTLSGASGLGITDYRTAGDAKVTKYFDRYAIGVGGAYSHERDYISRSFNADLRTWTDDKNRTYAFGIAGTRDDINSTNGVAQGQHREVYDFLFGVTQALSPLAIVESNLTVSDGRGYYSDPYKLLDQRPHTRTSVAWLTRYNRQITTLDATLKVAYRYIYDQWGVNAHMGEVAWVQALPHAFTVTPLVRYYTQDNAYFYYGPPVGHGFHLGQPISSDNRLAAYGAFTLGLDLAKRFDDGWSADIAANMYRQKNAWRPGGGTDGILDFSARWFEVGISKTF